MKEHNISVIAAIVDVHNLTLYKENGETITIPQGDPRVRRIVDHVTPLLSLNPEMPIIVNIAEDTEEESNAYADFENKSSGGMRFFRVAKHLVKRLFGQNDEPTPVPEMVIGTPPQVMSANRIKTAVAEIIANAVPASSPKFHEQGLDVQAPITDGNGETPKAHGKDNSLDTIVAVVGGKVVPGVERIRNQFAVANKLGSTVGVENFIKRLGSIIEQRSHSVEDLLKFMERGDLPIADDGSILVYKVLNHARGGNKTEYVDCRTGKVRQWVGAYVCMDSTLVDHNRNNECSNGLHIARRGYVGGFGGSVCVLAKVAPEDVITVPSYDANKMRACGYHIIAELTDAQFALLKNNQPLTRDVSGGHLLAQAIKGLHANKTHEIRIHAQHGGKVVVTALNTKGTTFPPITEVIKPVNALPDKGEILTDSPLDPRQVRDQVQMTRKEYAQKLASDYERVPSKEHYDALMALKKASKVSWERLGITEPKAFDPLALVATTNPHTPKAKVEKPPRKAPTKAKVKSKAKPAPKPQPTPAKAQQGPSQQPPAMLTYKDRIRGILGSNGGKLTTTKQAQAVAALKKEAKKGWAVLGVSDAELAKITTLLSK